MHTGPGAPCPGFLMYHRDLILQRARKEHELMRNMYFARSYDNHNIVSIGNTLVLFFNGQKAGSCKDELCSKYTNIQSNPKTTYAWNVGAKFLSAFKQTLDHQLGTHQVCIRVILFKKIYIICLCCLLLCDVSQDV